MSSATAGAAASIRIGASTYTYSPTYDPVIYGPHPIQPGWLSATLQCIRNSVVPNDRVTTNDGRWVSQEIADAANVFFQSTADLLPGEPTIYSSQGGDLVAEFKADHGTLTSVVTPTFVLMFAVIDGMPVERRVSSGGLRREVQELTEWLRMGQDGTLGTK